MYSRITLLSFLLPFSFQAFANDILLKCVKDKSTLNLTFNEEYLIKDEVPNGSRLEFQLNDQKATAWLETGWYLLPVPKYDGLVFLSPMPDSKDAIDVLFWRNSDRITANYVVGAEDQHVLGMECQGL